MNKSLHTWERLLAAARLRLQRQPTVQAECCGRAPARAPCPPATTEPAQGPSRQTAKGITPSPWRHAAQNVGITSPALQPGLTAYFRAYGFLEAWLRPFRKPLSPNMCPRTGSASSSRLS